MELAHGEPREHRHTDDEHGHGEQRRCVNSEKPIINAARPTNESTIDSVSIGCRLRGSTSNMNFAPMRIEMMPTANGTTYIDVRLT